MTSLTPASRRQEATSEASYEGMYNGLLTLVPSTALVVLLTKRNPAFARRTNMQSRTAMAIMPPLFVAALTAELKLAHKMKDIANETEHTEETVNWAEQQWQVARSSQQSVDEHQHLSSLYEESIKNSGVCIVNEMKWYHKFANYTSENPLKILTAVAVPAVGYIFYGRSGQEHLQLSSKIMHTRVFGQFLTIGSLLGVMAFKGYMDQNGRFISQEEADTRVTEMQRVRQQMLQRLEMEHERELAVQRNIAKAHERDEAKKKAKGHNNKDVPFASSAAAVAENH